MIDVGRVFSTSFAMMRQRFWLLVGMWLVFFVIQTAGSTVLGIAMALAGVAGFGAGAGLGGGFDDPAALVGMGVGLIIVMVLFYAGYIVLLLAQQAAMVALASPLEEPAFGAAMGRGFRSALPFLGITVLLILGYLAVAAATAAVAGVLGLADPALASAFGGVLALLFLPVLAYLGCRFAVVIPVVAVDEVFNPLAALRRSWAVTRGKVRAILLAVVGFVALSLVVLGVPVAMILGGIFSAEGSPEAGFGLVALGAIAFIPLMIAYTVFAAAFNAALHYEVTAGGAEQLEEVFA